MTVVAVLVLRIGLAPGLAARGARPDHRRTLLCPHCEQVFPDMAFCPACGVAARASSRSSRRARRLARPERDDVTTPPEPAGDHPARLCRPAGHLPRSAGAPDLLPPAVRNLVWRIAVLAASFDRRLGVGHQAAGALPVPPECGRPPIGAAGHHQSPVHRPRRRLLGVLSRRRGLPIDITTDDSGVTAKYVGGDTGPLQLFSQPAEPTAPRRRSPRR